MIVLMDSYTEETVFLQKTLQTIDSDCKIIVLEESFFLPDGMQSIYEYFVQQKEKIQFPIKDLYYAFLEMPLFWQVRAEGVSGAVYSEERKKAQIYFRYPKEKRLVERVEWLAETGKTGKIDYYNKYGFVGCKELYDTKGNSLYKNYCTSRGEEIISCNQATGSIILFEEGQVKAVFDSKSQMEQYLCRTLLQTNENLVLTSLRQVKLLQGIMGEDTRNVCVMLNSANDIAGYQSKYPLFILNHYNNANDDINTLDIRRVCYCSEDVPLRSHVGDFLILTASDELESINELIESFPEKQFHIAAPTLVSDKLKALTNYHNVKIYPVVKKEQLQQLLDISGVYLDINHYREVDNVVIRASMSQQVVLGYENTLHDRYYLLDECIFGEGDSKGLIRKLQEICADENVYRAVLEKQNQKIKSSTDVLALPWEKRG